ncbi:MAG: hypothetical protein WC044_05775 [Crocinitomicaceae bacterium]
MIQLYLLLAAISVLGLKTIQTTKGMERSHLDKMNDLARKKSAQEGISNTQQIPLKISEESIIDLKKYSLDMGNEIVDLQKILMKQLSKANSL